jgi:hypothetical protein
MSELVQASPPRAELLLRAYAEAKARYGEEMGRRRLAYPDGKEFPDPFREDEPSVRALLRRMQVLAGMGDIPIHVQLIETDVADASCASGACAVPEVKSSANLSRVTDEGDGWRILVSTPELKHPVFLTTELARALGLIFILETEVPGDPAPTPFLIELAAVQLGFGGILLQGAYVYQKACSGPRINQLTSLNVSEIGLLTIVMARDTGSVVGRLRSLLEATQRAALDEAEELLRAHPSYLGQLAKDPRLAARGAWKSEEPKGILSRWIERWTQKPAEAPAEGDLEAWQRALEDSDFSKRRESRALPSQDLSDLVKSEL